MKRVFSCVMVLGLILGLAACSNPVTERDNAASAPGVEMQGAHAGNPLAPSAGNPATNPPTGPAAGVPTSGW